MLYEGTTVHDALAQALGKEALGRKKTKYPSKPSTYGKPIYGTTKKPLSSGGKLGTKPSNFGKQQDGQDNPNGTPEAIRVARIEAVQMAKNRIGQESIREGEDEVGVYVVYNLTTGLNSIVNPPASGRAVRDPRAGTDAASKWRFTFNRSSNSIIMCSAHSHPKANRPSGQRGVDPYARIDRQNTIVSSNSGQSNLNSDDARLLRVGPVVIKNPTGTLVSVWGDWWGQ